MREKFKQQLEENKTVTEESIANYSKNKTYHNGDEMKVGDKPLFGMLLHIDGEDKQLELIMLNESQIDLYESDDRYAITDTRIPLIKLK